MLYDRPDEFLLTNLWLCKFFLLFYELVETQIFALKPNTYIEAEFLEHVPRAWSDGRLRSAIKIDSKQTTRYFLIKISFILQIKFEKRWIGNLYLHWFVERGVFNLVRKLQVSTDNWQRDECHPNLVAGNTSGQDSRKISALFEVTLIEWIERKINHVCPWRAICSTNVQTANFALMLVDDDLYRVCGFQSWFASSSVETFEYLFDQLHRGLLFHVMGFIDRKNNETSVSISNWGVNRDNAISCSDNRANCWMKRKRNRRYSHE